MATCSLRFYKRSQLKPDKNWCFDNIEIYLASLTYYDVSNYQYQRFELDKEIRVDFTQSEQTISSSANKYDYVRISTVVNNAPIYYYYFIIKTRQVSESTIAYQLRMDTLNTFKFDSTFANNKYTLSPKTLVKREHKDRMDNSIKYISSEDNFTDDGYIQNTPINDRPLIFNVNEFAIGSYSYFFAGWHYTIQLLDNNNNVVSNYDLKGTLTISVSSSLFSITSTDYATSEAVSFGGGIDYKFILTIKFSVNIGTAMADYNDLVVNDSHPRANPKIVYPRIIDEYQEGLSTQLFKKNEKTLVDKDDNNQWYLVYSSANAINPTDTPSTILVVNPVQVRFYSDKGYTISTNAAHEVILYASSPAIPKWNNTAEYIFYNPQPAPAAGTQYIKINGTTYDLHDYQNFRAKRTNNSDLVFSSVSIVDRATLSTISFTNIESITFYGINSIGCEDDWNKKSSMITIGSGTNNYSGSCTPWNQVDLTDPRLIKAFAFPYAPLEFLEGKDTFEDFPEGVSFSTGDNVIQLTNRNVKFNYQKRFDTDILENAFIDVSQVNFARGVSRNIIYESKLFHSDYYQPKFVYDSFAFTFNLEDIDNKSLIEQFEDVSTLYTSYVISSNIQSKFMFQFDSYVLKRSTQNYDNVLCIERNNEKALFNNSFINYVRSGGYSYETKKASSQNAVNGVTTALSIVGSVASFASSGATGGAGIAAGVGLAIGAAAGIIRSVHTAQEQDRAISQKITQQIMESTSVQGSEDIDILTAFSGNKAKIVEYKLSDIMQTAMWDLFHYCGYATHEQKIPDVTTRLYFNFVQAEIVFDEYNFNEEIADDIQNKWNEGVTFFHAVSGAYDINQEYENFETSLL